jgi:scyllo-inositol 2-dehydrogenase (NADP+)
MLNLALCAYGMSGKVFHAPLISANPKLKLHSILQRNEPSALADYPELNVVKRFEDIIGGKYAE